MQQNELEEQQAQAESLEERVDMLEAELKSAKKLLSKTLHALEQHLGKDVDGDGRF